MRYKRVPRVLIEETLAIIRLKEFLARDCGFEWAESLSARQLKQVLKSLRVKGLKKH